MKNKIKFKWNIKYVAFVLALVIFIVSIFSVFYATKQNNPIQLKINDVLQANQAIKYDSCVNQVEIVDFEETNNANYILQMYFWDCEQFTNKENKINTIQANVEKYLRTIEKIANENNFDSGKLGDVFDSNSFKINIMYNNQSINSAFVEKTLQKITWENEWQNIN
jgi:hypothetical protein